MEQNTISKQVLKKTKRGAVCLFMVVTLVFTSIALGFAAEAKSKTKCVTVTEGNFTTITTTTTTENLASKSVEITRLIQNLQTKEVVRKTETKYENPGIGVKVISDTERNNVEGKEITTGNIEGIYDTTCYVKGIKDSSYNIEIKSDAVEQIMGCIAAQRASIERDATIEKTVNFYAYLENLNTFTINIPKSTVTKLKNDDYNLKVSTAYSYIEFYNKDLQKLLDGKSNNLLITLTKIETKNSLGTRIAINNGKQIIGFSPSKVEIGIGYDGSFGLDPDRIELSTIGADYKEKSIKEGISYSDNTHMIVFTSDTISEYWINIEAVNFEDVQKHWAKKAIDKWSDCGVVTGYQGKFNPNANIRRGDMAVIINKIMCYEKPAKNSFTDLKGTEYFAEAILKANGAGVLNGSGNKVRPNDNITREEAAVILCKSMGIAPEATCNTSFEDESSISSWAKGSVNALVNKGILSGYGEKVKPKESITRAETVTILSNMITDLVNFGEYSKDINGNLLVNGKNTILKDMTIIGNLVIAEGVGDGDVTLENVKVTGTTVIRGGGDNSIKVKGNSSLQNVDLQKQTGSVRLLMDKSAKAALVNVNEKSEGVTLEGTMQNVQVNSKNLINLQNLKTQNITVKIENAKLKVNAMSHISKIDIVKNAKNTVLDVSGEVLNVAANAEGVKVEGTGKVDIVDISGNNVTVKTNGTQVKVASTATGAMAGKEAVAPGQTGKTEGSQPLISADGKVDVSVSPYAPNVDTSLVDGKTYKGSKLTFDVFAKDIKGKKISGGSCKVTINGEAVKINWDDDLKTSYTLNLTEGNNTVVIEATADGETTKKSYDIKYSPGTMQATVSIELFTLGEGYLITPTTVDINDGENAAYMLDRFLSENGFEYEKTGSLDKGFYLSAITGSEIANLPVTADKIPSDIKSILQAGNYTIKDRDDKNSLGEFDYTRGSGWMYSVNGVFPNVGFADTYLQDGDKVRIQFTLALGDDIGGGYCIGGK